jgi:hypothetical protein
MKKSPILLFVLPAVVMAIVACQKDSTTTPPPVPQAPVVISATGDITTSMNNFRNLLGNPLNTTPGQSTGRRELNWDAVPAQFQTQSMPKDFFNPTGATATQSLQRGFLYETNGDFRVSNNGFGNIESTLSAQLQPFSGDKVFANVNETVWDTQFRVAGTTQTATIKGFGAVFLDVDVAQNSFLEFFNGTTSLGKFYAPVHDVTNGFSFLGVYFKDQVVTNVKIGHGNAPLSSAEKDITNGGAHDIVALDDFLYDEPKAK